MSDDTNSTDASAALSGPGPAPIAGPPEAAAETLEVTPEQEREGARFFEEMARLEEPIYEHAVYWYPAPVTIPKATKIIFDTPELYGSICDFCRSMMNLVVAEDDRVIQTLCERCRVVVGRHESNHCAGGTEDCELYRYVDAVGAVSHLCRGCHRYGEALRRNRRERGRRPGRRHDSLVVK